MSLMRIKKLTDKELEQAFVQIAGGPEIPMIRGHIAALKAEVAQGIVDYDRRTDQLNCEVRAREKAEAEVSRLNMLTRGNREVVEQIEAEVRAAQIKLAKLAAEMNRDDKILRQ